MTGRESARAFTINDLVEAGIVAEGFEDDALARLAEHDAAHHAEVLAEVEQLQRAARSAAVIFRTVASRADVQQHANPAMLRQAAADLDKLARVAPGKAGPAGPTATQPAPNEAAFTAVASPMEYGYLISVRRDPHPEGHVPVAMERLHTDTGWDPAAADALLLDYDRYTTAPGSYWQPMGEGRYGIRLRRAEGGDAR